VEKLQRDFEQNHLIQWLEQAVVDTLTARPVRMGGTDQLGGRKRTDWCGGDGENRLVGREGKNQQREGGGWLRGRGERLVGKNRLVWRERENRWIGGKRDWGDAGREETVYMYCSGSN